MLPSSHKFFNSYGKFYFKKTFLFHFCSKPLVKWLDAPSHVKQMIWEHSVEQLLFNHSNYFIGLVYFMSFNSVQTIPSFTFDLLCAFIIFQTREAFTSEKHFLCCSTKAYRKYYLRTFHRLLNKSCRFLQMHV